MAITKELLVHIGYHKTASTWLQENLFDNPDSGFQRFFSQKDARDKIALANPLDFNAQELKKYYEEQIDSDKYSVISNERLSGNPHSGGYDSKDIADKIHEAFPEAKILIVIREQRSILFSNYIQYIRAGGPCSIEDYLNPSKRNMATIPLFNYHHFAYLSLVKYYYKLFGKDKVLVLPYELFQEDAKAFCQEICKFTGTKVIEELAFQTRTNRRISTLSSIFLRQSNKLFAKSHFNPSALSLKKAKAGDGEGRGNSYKKILAVDSVIPRPIHKLFDNRLKKIIEAEIGDRYLNSNQELSKLINYELSDYGYLI